MSSFALPDSPSLCPIDLASTTVAETFDFEQYLLDHPVLVSYGPSNVESMIEQHGEVPSHVWDSFLDAIAPVADSRPIQGIGHESPWETMSMGSTLRKRKCGVCAHTDGNPPCQGEEGHACDLCRATSRRCRPDGEYHFMRLLRLLLILLRYLLVV